MTHLAAAALAITACAGAASPAAPVPHAGACPIDAELYGLDVGLGDDTDEAAAKLRVYRSGAWTYVADGAAPRGGCLAPRDLERIARALDRATWMQIVSPGPCDPPHHGHAIHYVDGRAAYEAHCQTVPDEPTRAALAEIDAILAPARAP